MNDIPFPYYCITINKLQYCIVMYVCKFVLISCSVCLYNNYFDIFIDISSRLAFQFIYDCFQLLLFISIESFVSIRHDFCQNDDRLSPVCMVFFFQSTIDVKIYFQPILLINLRKLSVTIKIRFN